MKHRHEVIKNEYYYQSMFSHHIINNQIMNKGKFIYEAQDEGINDKSDQQLAKEYQWIDRLSLIAFPILFFVFNMFYWLAYMI